MGCAQTDWRGAPPPPPEVEGIQRPELVAFTPEDDLGATPSPDGRYLIFASEQNGNLDVWVRDFGTNSIYPLTIASPTDDFDPQISPDGKRLAFVSRRDDAKGDLFLADGFEQEDEPDRLTDEKTADRQPVFSPDGKRLYFTSAAGVAYEAIDELSSIAVERDGSRRRPASTPRILGRPMDDLHRAAWRGGPALPAPRGDASRRLGDACADAVIAPEGLARFVPARKTPSSTCASPTTTTGTETIDPNDNASLWWL